MKPYRIIVAGSRSFNDYPKLRANMDTLTLRIDFDELEIVSGTARGADQLGELWAENNDLVIRRFPAHWDKRGKAAGYVRNEQMAKYATHLIAFWDGKSKGTAHMIKLAKKHDLIVQVVTI